MTYSALSQQNGIASYYSDALTGLTMANGDRYDPEVLTCAHKTVPLGSIVKIHRKDQPEHSVVATVTDRGPFITGRIIDLSRRAARELGILDVGITEVVVAVIRKPRELKKAEELPSLALNSQDQFGRIFQ
jgi:rare lipoprotein A